MNDEATLTRNTLVFTAYTTVSAAVFSESLHNLVRLGLSSTTYSYVLAVPFISLVLVLRQKKQIFRYRSLITVRTVAFLIFIVSATWLIRCCGWLWGNVNNSLMFYAVLLTASILLGFRISYGAPAFRAGRFPLVFLFVIAPPPEFLMDKVIRVLQVASAQLTYWIFVLTGTPVFRVGTRLAVPGVTIEVAPECSGIRSTVAVLITCLIAGYLLLRTPLSRGILLLAALPVVVIKNGIRIAALTLLSIHVDPSFLTGRLHREGGFLFFGVGLLILLPVLRWRRRAESGASAIAARRLDTLSEPSAR